MNISRSLGAAALLVLATIGVAVWGWYALPADAYLAYHQSFGAPSDSHLDKTYALGLMPVIAIVVVGCLALIPRVTPNPEGLERSPLPYGLLVVSVAGVLLVTQVSLVERMMNAGFDVLRTVFLSVAVLLLILGNYLGKVRHNHVFGVRTPWTLKDPRVWDKTHRFTGRIMVASAVVLAAGCLLVPGGPALVALLVLCAGGPVLLGALYSRRAWRQDHPVQA